MSKTKARWTVQPVADPTGLRIGALWCGDSLVSYLYNNMAKELSRIVSRGQAKPKICVWTWDADRSTSTSACGYKSRWFDDDPRNKVHGTNYCHACGGKVVWKDAK